VVDALGAIETITRQGSKLRLPEAGLLIG